MYIFLLVFSLKVLTHDIIDIKIVFLINLRILVVFSLINRNFRLDVFIYLNLLVNFKIVFIQLFFYLVEGIRNLALDLIFLI